MTPPVITAVLRRADTAAAPADARNRPRAQNPRRTQTAKILRSKWLALQFSSFCAYSAPLRGYSIVFYPAALVVIQRQCSPVLSSIS